MLKKITFYIFIVASLGIAIWGYFKLKENKEPNVIVTEHIPGNAICIIESKKNNDLISQLTRQNLIWNSLLNNASITAAQNGIRYLDSLANSYTEIADVLKDNLIYWSFIPVDKTTEHLILFKIKEKNDESMFTNFFTKNFLKDSFVSSFEAYSITINKQKWIICIKDGIVYLSSDLVLLQNCLELNKETSIANNKKYTDLIKLNGKQNTKFYINHNLTNCLNKQLFTQQSLFDVDVKLNEITLTGYSNVDTTSFLNTLNQQNATSINSYGYLPNNPATIKAISIDNPQLFYKELSKQIPEKETALYTQSWQKLNDTALYNIKKENLDNIDNEIILATYILENEVSDVLSIKIKEVEKSKQLLSFISDSIMNLNEFKVYKINSNYLKIFPFVSFDFKGKYAVVTSDNLLFFSSNTLLEYYKSAYTNNNFIGKNKDFMNYANDNLSQECNYLYYENKKITNTFNLNSIINLPELQLSENAVSEISFTSKNYKQLLQTRLNINHQKEKSSNNNSSNYLWSFSADTIINTSAYLFKNHLTKENELCFQDIENNFYLINTTGSLIWKKKLNEAILSSIYTVDLFKNGKLQLLFNTQNYIHLIDRNGNYVQGFPVKTPAKISSNITLLDYDDNKDYRLFIACTDKYIYNFSLYGVKTEGFKPVKTKAEVILPINYIHLGASDYLITADINGNIYGFSRKGEGRTDLKNKTIQNLNHLYISVGNNLDNTKLLYLDDTDNLLNKISLTDKKEVIKIGDDLSGFKTSFDLINDDQQFDILVYGNGGFYCYDAFTNKLFEYLDPLTVYNDVRLAQYNNNNYFIAFDKSNQKVDIISVNGKLLRSIQSVTQKPFTTNLYDNEKNYLLIINGNKMSCDELQ